MQGVRRVGILYGTLVKTPSAKPRAALMCVNITRRRANKLFNAFFPSTLQNPSFRFVLLLVSPKRCLPPPRPPPTCSRRGWGHRGCTPLTTSVKRLQKNRSFLQLKRETRHSNRTMDTSSQWSMLRGAGCEMCLGFGTRRPQQPVCVCVCVCVCE